MNQSLRLNKKQIKRNILVWIIIIAYLNFDAPVHGPFSAKIVGGAVESLNYILVFYIMSLFIIPEFWVKRRTFWLILCILVCYGLFFTITFFNYLKIIQYFGGYTLHQNRSIIYLLIKDIFYFFIVASAAAASFYYRYSIQHYKTQFEKIKILLIKELNFLKNQFNSHITFNFLNYCYSKVHQILPNTAESIGLFSDNLRYALQTKPEERVFLNDEIVHINNFIYLQRLLFENVYVNFTVYGDYKDKYIYPRILISMVENAFLFGITDDSRIPTKIDMKVEGVKFYLTVSYKQKSDFKILDFKSDMNFVLQTLNLYYPENFLLKQELRNNLSCIELILSIEEDITKYTSNKKIRKKFTENADTIKDGADIKSLMHLTKRQIGRHVIAWIIIIAFGNIYNHYSCSLLAVILIKASINLNCMFVFYSIRLFIFPKFWEEQKIKLVISILIILFIYWTNVYFIFKVMMPALGEVVSIAEYTLPHFFKERFYYFVIFGSAGVFAFFSRYGVFKIKQQEQKEKMLLGKELYYLKNQFNSPLTFSFLKYCSDNMRKHSPETADSIGIFSDMLRYTLQTSPEEKVPLKDEIVYIEDFISIQKLLSERVYAEFIYQGEIKDKKILSRILVTFVENAFKHGLYNNSGYPIQINLMVANKNLLFTIKNRINPSKRLESTKKGIENVTQILDLYYDDKYELKKEITGDVYSVELSLEID